VLTERESTSKTYRSDIKCFKNVYACFMFEAEEKTEMGRFSKNFLPILFNVFSQQPAAGEPGTYRMAVLDTIKVYLSVTEMQVSQFCSALC